MAFLSPYWIVDVALVFLSAFVTLYLYATRNFNYWLKKGVTEVTPVPFFGNFMDCFLFRTSPAQDLEKFYEKGKDLPYLGIYVLDRPALLLRDPDIIKSVLVRDFNVFADRHATAPESDTLGCSNLFLSKNPRWKNLRGIMSPVFTSGKLKVLFQLMLEIGKDLDAHLEDLQLEGHGRVIEMRELSVMYTMDVITGYAFGYQSKTLRDPDAVFMKYCANIFSGTGFIRGFEFMAYMLAPHLSKLLKLKFFSAKASDFMRAVVLETINGRIEQRIAKNDFIDMLVRAKQRSATNDSSNTKLEDSTLVSLAATLFAGAFETTSVTIAFSLYELAINMEMQSKVREEIKSALAETDGEITFEMMSNLPYLQMVVSETLRKYPAVPFLDRIAMQDYQIPGTELVIEKGTPVYISLYGLHYDAEYFPDPQNFDPKRFTKENKQKYPPYAYIPFGEGPRACVGIRLGLMQSMLGIIKIILNHEISQCEQTLVPMRLLAKSLFPTADGGIFVNIRKIGTPIH